MRVPERGDRVDHRRAPQTLLHDGEPGRDAADHLRIAYPITDLYINDWREVAGLKAPDCANEIVRLGGRVLRRFKEMISSANDACCFHALPVGFELRIYIRSAVCRFCEGERYASLF